MRSEEILKKVMEVERDGINAMINGDLSPYANIVDLLMKTTGKVVFMGIGKSGHIGEKLAATFSSTGTPSFFVHAGEATHGDFGMIEKKDVVILISNSGTTKEIVNDIPFLKRIGCKIIGFTSNPESQLAKESDYQLIYPKRVEADHLNLAPTTSSTITLVLGDAIACTLSQLKGFRREDFYKYHPGGALGETLSKE